MLTRSLRMLVLASAALFMFGDGETTQTQGDTYVCPQYPRDETVVIDRRSNKLVTPTGERIFPFGFYDLSWVGTTEEQRSVYRRIADAGFNFMYFSLTSADDDMMDAAAEDGVYIIAESADPYGVDLPIYEYDSHPAMIGWLIADDFNNPASPFTPARVNQLNQELKAKTPNKLSYISGGPYRLTEYNDYADIIGIQSYSYPFQPLSDMSGAYNCALVNIGDDPETTLLANLQAFPLTPSTPAPDGLSQRLMTYQVLLNGMDGILYYAYRAPDWNIESMPEAWPTFEEMACEVSVLEPILVDGILTRRAAPLDVFVGEWSYPADGTGMMVVVNTREEPIDVSFPVSYSNAAPRFSHIPAQLTLRGGALTGTLAPQSMTVLSLANGATTAPVDCSVTRLDANRDGHLTSTDATYILNRLGTNDTNADVNYDRVVNRQDAQQVLAKLGTPLN